MFITDEIQLSSLSYPLYCGKELGNALFFDIETSGVSFLRSHITVIGAAFLGKNRDSLRICQWFADTPASESRILADFLRFTDDFDTLVTYNGMGFDVPYLKKRAEYYSLDAGCFDRMGHLDLFRYSRLFAALFRLPDRKLKTIEEGLFLERNDRVSGADCIDLYRGYLSTGDKKMRDLILLHNREDAANLADVTHIISYNQLRHGDFEVRGFETGEYTLTIKCRLYAPVPRPFRLDLSEYNISAEDDRMTVVFKGRLCEKKLFRKDYRNYYYLKNEDCAVHKSVGQFIAREAREPAKASNCYERYTGVFFAQPEPVITPDFRDSHKAKAAFFRMEEAKDPDAETLHRLCHSVLNAVFSKKRTA